MMENEQKRFGTNAKSIGNNRRDDERSSKLSRKKSKFTFRLRFTELKMMMSQLD